MYLVDTNVISSLAPGRPAPAFATWLHTHSDDLFLSAISVTEIQDGIAKARREAAGRKADNLNAWLETLLHLYAARVLAIDVSVARAAGDLSDKARALGRPTSLADILIAATAHHHGLTVLTRNTKHFQPLGVAMHNPFDSLPS